MAAGQGFKTFTTGEVLTAGDVNGYLMQGINVFASSAARASAITSPQEGQYSFLKDTNALEYYDGSAWVGAPVGDITAITATSPLTGGGSSGDVTVGIQDASTSQKGSVQLSDSTSTTSSVLAATPTAVKSAYDLANAAIPKSTVTTSGDIIYATGSSAVTRRAIGTTGQVLTVSGGVPTWATPAGGGGGKVLQVVQGTTATTATMSSSTPADTNLTATITPTLSTSKILIICTQEYYFNKNSSSPQVGLRIMRDATSIINWGSYGAWNLGTGVTNTDGRILQGFSYLDSPATTSAVTYKTQGSTNNTTTITFQETGTSTIILMEIGA